MGFFYGSRVHLYTQGHSVIPTGIAGTQECESLILPSNPHSDFSVRFGTPSMASGFPSRTGMLLRSKRPACSERCKLDLPGFKNLEGLHYA